MMRCSCSAVCCALLLLLACLPHDHCATLHLKGVDPALIFNGVSVQKSLPDGLVVNDHVAVTGKLYANDMNASTVPPVTTPNVLYAVVNPYAFWNLGENLGLGNFVVYGNASSITFNDTANTVTLQPGASYLLECSMRLKFGSATSASLQFWDVGRDLPVTEGNFTNIFYPLTLSSPDTYSNRVVEMVYPSEPTTVTVRIGEKDGTVLMDHTGYLIVSEIR